jgi:hypothetical protein
MESINISYGLFEELETCIYETEEIQKKFPDDFGLKLGLTSLKDFKKSAIIELRRRSKEENDPKAVEILLWLERNGISE